MKAVEAVKSAKTRITKATRVLRAPSLDFSRPTAERSVIVYPKVTTSAIMRPRSELKGQAKAEEGLFRLSEVAHRRRPETGSRLQTKYPVSDPGAHSGHERSSPVIHQSSVLEVTRKKRPHRARAPRSHRIPLAAQSEGRSGDPLVDVEVVITSYIEAPTTRKSAAHDCLDAIPRCLAHISVDDIRQETPDIVVPQV